MFLADYHMHSRVSPDAKNSMAEMAAAAQAHGMREICFTDHVEVRTALKPTPGDLELFPEPPVAMRLIEEEFAAAQAHLPAGLAVRVGMELGEAHHDPCAAALAAKQTWADFIIGSVHNLRHEEDFYFMRYESLAQCRTLMERYLLELHELAALDCFDVMGHIGYTQRYMSRQGFPLRYTVAEHGELLQEIFRRLIDGGRGIEVNCSGLRPGDLGDCFPSLELLQLYREMGGEIVTVGSDGHSVAQAGLCIADGYERLRAAGFRYVTTFRQRRAQFVPIA